MPTLQEINAEIAKRERLSAIDAEIASREGGAVDYVTEPLVSIGANLAGTVTSGLGGIYELIKTGDIDKAAQAVEQMQSSISDRFQPQTEKGKEGLQDVASAIQTAEESIIRPAIAGTAGLADIALNPVSNIREGFAPAKQTVESVKDVGLSKSAGQEVLQRTGSPLLAAATETFSEASPDILGGLFALSKVKAPDIKFNKRSSKLQQEIAERIKSGAGDKDLANKMLNESGKVVSDKVATETIKQGFDEGVVSAIKSSSPTDKAKMLRMINTLEKGKNNARYAVKNRPADVAGDSLLKQVRFIKKLNSDSGRQLNRVASGLKGKPIDVSNSLNGFIDDMSSIGVEFNENMTPIFDGSTIETIAPAKKLVKDIALKIRRNPNMDAFQAHEFKKFIDENVTFGKQAKGLGGKTESIAKKLRSSINETIGSQYDNYAQANKQFSDTITAIDNLQSASGSSVNLFGPQSEKALGTTLRRLMNNTQSRVNLMDSIDEIKNVSSNYGGSFGDDIMSQMLFADELDSVFGPAARTSLAGETAKGVRFGADVAEGGAFRAAVDLAAEGVEKLRGINEKNAIKSMKELLRQGQ